MGKLLFLSVLLVGFAVGQEPPPFGTVIEQWNLPMSGTYAGAGITWNPQAGRLFLTDQNQSQPNCVWQFDPADPIGTITAAPWKIVNLGGPRADIMWGVVWDSDSGCFWTSQILDGNPYVGCYLLRYTWDDSMWVWAGSPGDSWLVTGPSSSLLYITGMEKWPGRGFLTGPVRTNPPPDSAGLLLLDPYAKRLVGIIGDSACSGRGVALVSYDSCYILSCGWNRNQFRKHDSTGGLLQAVQAPVEPADWALYVPHDINPDDTVCAYCICCNLSNTLLRVSLGMLWSQLGSVGVRDQHKSRFDTAPDVTFVRGMLRLPGKLDAVLLDITGRRVMDLQPGRNDIRHVAPGVYFVTGEGSRGQGFEGSRKIVIQN